MTAQNLTQVYSDTANYDLFGTMQPAQTAFSADAATSGQVTASNKNFDPLTGANLQATNSALALSTAGNFDVQYTYYYVYGNGDFYYGEGYADASAGYQAGQYFYPINDETSYQGYNTGYYYIASVTNLGVDDGMQNQVYVRGYYDAETASYASYLYDYYTGAYGYGSGYSGLGSELGYAYNYSFTNSDVVFGAGYYEADLTTTYV